jgi:mRNA interferase MazF
MNIQRGDIIIVDYPYASGTGRKQRPAVVVQSDTNNRRLSNTIVVGITSNISRAHEPTQILLLVASPEGKQSGIIVDSVVSCENILTIENGLVSRKIGHLPATLMQCIDQALKVSLALT